MCATHCACMKVKMEDRRGVKRKVKMGEGKVSE